MGSAVSGTQHVAMIAALTRLVWLLVTLLPSLVVVGHVTCPTAIFDLCARQVESFPYSDVLPFLSEHVQPSDQMLVMGCMSELPLQLSRDGYGTRCVGVWRLEGNVTVKVRADDVCCILCY